jgi:hypothetical protein
MMSVVIEDALLKCEVSSSSSGWRRGYLLKDAVSFYSRRWLNIKRVRALSGVQAEWRGKSSEGY